MITASNYLSFRVAHIAITVIEGDLDRMRFPSEENECFQEALQTTQRKLLKASRDKSFLLDRLLTYEKVDVSSSDDDDTESSDNGEPPQDLKRKKMDHGPHIYGSASSGNSSKSVPAKKRRIPQRPPKQNTAPQLSSLLSSEGLGDGHMTPEEVERHLESQQGHMELIPSKVPSTVPPDLFSNDPSFDSELNEVYCELDTSPNDIADECLTVDMMPD